MFCLNPRTRFTLTITLSGPASGPACMNPAKELDKEFRANNSFPMYDARQGNANPHSETEPLDDGYTNPRYAWQLCQPTIGMVQMSLTHQSGEESLVYAAHTVTELLGMGYRLPAPNRENWFMMKTEAGEVYCFGSDARWDFTPEQVIDEHDFTVASVLKSRVKFIPNLSADGTDAPITPNGGR